MFTIVQLENAINHILATEKAEEHSIPRDARILGDVYGAMIWTGEKSREKSSLKEIEREVFERWKII